MGLVGGLSLEGGCGTICEGCWQGHVHSQGPLPVIVIWNVCNRNTDRVLTVIITVNPRRELSLQLLITLLSCHLIPHCLEVFLPRPTFVTCILESENMCEPVEGRRERENPKPTLC